MEFNINNIYKLCLVIVLLQQNSAKGAHSHCASLPNENITVEQPDIKYITSIDKQSVISRVIDVQWQDYLSGALTLLNALSSLLVVSEGNVIDISSATGANATKKDLYHTIVILIQETWETFAETEFSMMRCRHAGKSLVFYSTKIVQTLKTKSVEKINTLIPMYAEAMDDSSSTCLKYTTNSSNKILKTVMLGTNLERKLSNEKSMNIEELNNIEKKMTTLNSKKQMYKTILKRNQHRLEVILDEVAHNRDNFIKTFNKINSKSAAERGFTRFVKSVTAVLLPSNKIDTIVEEEINNSTTLNEAEISVDKKFRKKIFDCFVLIESQKLQKVILEIILGFSRNITIITNITTSQDSRRTTEFKKLLMLQFDIWSYFLIDIDDNAVLKPLYQKFLNESTSTLEKLGQKTLNKNETLTTTQCVTTLLNSLKCLDDMVGVTYESESECNEAKRIVLKSESKPKVHDEDNELYILKGTIKQLEKSEINLNNTLERTLQFSNKMQNNLKELNLKNFTDINMKKVQEIVILSIKFLSEINEGWIGTEKIASLLHESITTMRNYSLYNFLETIAFEPSFFSNSSRALDWLSVELNIIIEYSTYIQAIADTYVEISRTYLLGPMSEISKLVGKKTEKEKRMCLFNLQDKCEAAKSKINLIVIEKRNLFLNRKKETKRKLNCILSS